MINFGVCTGRLETMEAIFETNPVFLSSLLGDLRTGRIQLPDFQRGWVWEDERIRGVLASPRGEVCPNP